MEETTGTELTEPTLASVQEILNQAGSMMQTGVSGEALLITVVAVPLALKGLDLIRPYLQVHADDRSALVHSAHIERLAELRTKVGEEVFRDAMTAMDSGSAMSMSTAVKKK